MLSRGRAVVARRAHNPEVVGSNPTPATLFWVAARWAGVAQWLEQRLHKAMVRGSNPLVGTENFWARGVVWLTHPPVTGKIASSNLVAPAKKRSLTPFLIDKLDRRGSTSSDRKGNIFEVDKLFQIN